MASETCFLRSFFFMHSLIVGCWFSADGGNAWRQATLMIQRFFLYVFFHTLGHKFLDWAFCLHCIADFGRRNLLIHIVQQVQNDSWKNEVALGRLLRKRFRGLCPGTESL